MSSEDLKNNDQTQGDRIKSVDEKQDKQGLKNFWRFMIPVLIVAIAAGLYLLKNPIGGSAKATIDPAKGEYASAEFDLDATVNFDLDKILSYGLPVIVDFGADSCIPCKEMAPILAALNQDLRGQAIVKFVDVWKNNKASGDLPLEVIPTQFFFNADGSPYKPADEEAAIKNGFILYEMRDSGEHAYTVHQGFLDKESLLKILKEMGME